MEVKISNSDYGEAQNWKVLVIAFRFLEEVALSYLSIFDSKKLPTQQVKGCYITFTGLNVQSHSGQ